METRQRRVLERLASGPEWRPRHDVQTWLGRDARAVDEAVEAGWIVQESVRVGARGRLRRMLRISREGLVALMGQAASPHADEWPEGRQ